ncbi:MAG: hypothetical protein ABSH47_24380 [Bryobacteraceae bacterium]|jgi:hypothetical protein
MPSEAQIQANRRNAQASTGPRTLEGKAISSANSTKHGLSGGFRVLPGEIQEEFDELVAEYYRTFAPTNTHECFLVEEIVQARWRLARARRLEAGIIEDMIAIREAVNADAAMSAALYNDTARPFTELQRYAASIERTGHRALQQLLALRKLAAQTARNAAPRNEPNSTSPGNPHPPVATRPTPSNNADNGAYSWSDRGPAGGSGPASPDRREEAPNAA